MMEGIFIDLTLVMMMMMTVGDHPRLDLGDDDGGDHHRPDLGDDDGGDLHRPDLGDDDHASGDHHRPDLGDNDDDCGDHHRADLGDDACGGDHPLPAVPQGEGDLSLLTPEPALLHSELQAGMYFFFFL